MRCARSYLGMHNRAFGPYLQGGRRAAAINVSGTHSVTEEPREDTRHRGLGE
jgi:hypothetical protein